MESSTVPEFTTNEALQSYLLERVSRTFALTIPQLPTALKDVVSNAYLLCRIIDTIEDEPALSLARKRYFCHQFIDVLNQVKPAEQFAVELAPMLSSHVPQAEHQLIHHTPRVIAITHNFNATQRQALIGCVELMAEGMVEFQVCNTTSGLADLVQMERYCYHVAGVVGEMLTKLFCDYSPAIAQHRAKLMPLSVSFGQGLQMTNILKDIWDDQRRDICWLPQEVFRAVGFDLRDLAPGRHQTGFGVGLAHLIGIAHQHLKNALAYTLLIPKQEKGIRNFCLWAIGLALLTLRKINKRRDFSSGNQVKISRRSVKATIVTSRLSVANDPLLRLLFQLAGAGLPRAPNHLIDKALFLESD